jgi:hypothetical protein
MRSKAAAGDAPPSPASRPEVFIVLIPLTVWELELERWEFSRSPHPSTRLSPVQWLEASATVTDELPHTRDD